MERPLVTFVLLCYNQETFIEDAVRGALNQTYEPLEVVVSDDCSNDTTFEIAERIVERYAGPHRVLLRRNVTNLGLAAHFNLLCELAKGSIIVVAAGDDISLPRRTELSVNLLRRYPDATTVSFRNDIIDEMGARLPQRRPFSRQEELKRLTLDEFITGVHPSFSGASRAFRRSVFRAFGPINESCPTEDTPMFLRSLMLGCAYLAPTPAVLYRRHRRNLSSVAGATRARLERIAGQYNADVESAESRGLIEAATARATKKWIDANFQRRQLKIDFEHAEAPFAFFARKVLLASCVPMREKIAYLWELVRFRSA